MNDMKITNENTAEVETRIRICRENYYRSLDLSDMGLVHIPDALQELEYLEVLKLNENNLTKLPDFIGSFKRLEFLDLSCNRVAALPETIGGLRSLETLNIRCNELTSIPESIGNLGLLTTLDISYNYLSNLPETMTKLIHLKHCSVKGNTFEKLPEKIIDLAKPRKENLLGHIGRIVALTKKHTLFGDFPSIVKVNIDYVCQKLHISPVQAVLFSHIVSQINYSTVSMQSLANSIDCDQMELLQHINDFNELAYKKLIRSHMPHHRSNTNCTPEYYIPKEVMTCLMKDEEYLPVNQSNLTITELFIRIESVLEQRICYNEISFKEMSADIIDLLNDNKNLSFVKNAFEYEFSEDTLMILIRFCHKYINLNKEEMELEDIARIFDIHSQFTNHQRQLINGEHILMACNLVEFANSGGFGDCESFKLTYKARHELLADLQVRTSHKSRDIICACKINEKKMFYNSKEAEPVAVLTSLLGIDSFNEIQKRLSESGMRTGFACLFSGPPGTGKTETVYQIARQTGRDIMMVDISETKSMWFGESEKRIKEIFTRYRNFVEDTEITPILFFNEADAVIGKRKDAASSSVAQTENTIQNIILQELENLKGILIATTNLTQNMDNAFERRFLYKIDFKKPCLEVRQSIWQSMIPALSDNDLKEIASHYDFSGGQIENIARKRAVELVLSGVEPSLEKLFTFCKEELLTKGTESKIGFIV